MNDTQLSKLEQLVARLESLTVTQQGYFSIKQAAAFTGLSAAHVRRAVVGGTLPCSNVGTRDRPTYRISREDIAKWMEQRKAGALPPPKRKRKAPIENDSLPFSPHRAKKYPQPVATVA